MTDPTESGSAGRMKTMAGFLLGTAFLLRLWIPGGAAGVGTNSFLHTLFLTGAFLGIISVLRKPAVKVYFSGTEIPMVIFVLLGFFSVTWASYVLPALQSAFAYGTMAILAFFLSNLFRTRPHILFTLLFGFLFVLSVYCLIQKYVLLPEARLAGALDPRFQGTEMAARLSSSEVFGTFLYPNSLAGFLVLALPIVGGMLLDLKKARFPGYLLLVLGGITLFLTGSLGGWVAFGLAGILLATLILTRNREGLRRLTWIATGTGTLLVVGLVVAGPLAPGKLENASMRMRDIYWSAAVRIAEEHPFLGVGLDNFQEYYPRYKGETQQETRKAHNDYLQILVELGVAGLLVFLAMIGMTFRHALRRPREPVPVEPSPHERGGLIGVGVASLFLAWMIEGTFGFLWGSVLAGTWIAFVWFWHPRQVELCQGGMEGTRLGCIAGFVGLLIHMSVDFDFYEFGLATAFFFCLSLIPLLGGRLFSIEVGRGVSIAFTGLLAILLIPLLLLVLPRLLEGDRASRTADAAKLEAGRLSLEAEEARVRGEALRSEEARIESDGRYTRAMQLYHEALQENPLDADFHLEYAALCLQLWDRIRSKNRHDEKTLLRLAFEESRAITALENVLAVRPRSIPGHVMLSTAHLRFSEHYGQLSGSLHQRMREEHLRKALDHARQTIVLYPTRAHAHYEAGRILAKTGKIDEARDSFVEALRFSKNAEKEGLDRLQLDVFQKARALFRTGREKEASVLLEDWFGVQLESSQKGSAPAKRLAIETFLGSNGRGEKLKAAIGEEFDPFLAPKIIGVLKKILASLPAK